MAVPHGLKFVDCHCHLTSDRFADDLEAVLRHARRAGVRGVLVCSSSLPDMLEVIKMRQEYPDFVFPCLGLHPLDVTFDPEHWSVARQLIREEHAARGVAAIGEIGLDFSRPILRERAAARGVTEVAVRDSQMASFREQVSLARELGVPVNVHSRNAERETLAVLLSAGVSCVMHAYKGAVALAVDAANKGLFFSFPPSIVYKSEYQEVARALPLTSLLLETDSPSLGASGPKERNEPCRIGVAAAKIAELRGLSVHEVAEATTKNAARLFATSARALVEAIERGPAEAVCGREEKKTARWRRTEQPTDAAAVLPDTVVTATAVGETSVPEPVPGVLRQGRWRRRGEDTVLDPTVCSGAFGSAVCT